ncbi:MAG: S8 family peptidase [Gaiellaceae bacterium]
MLGLALAGGIAAVGDAAALVPAAQEILVRFEPGAAQERALDTVDATLVERMPLGGLVRARLDPGVSLAAADRALERRSDVVAAGPNRTYELYATPDDTLYPELWGLEAIGAPLAWDVTQGSNSVVVAVVDTGADVTHPDLDANIWTNPDESANGLDDDTNGLVDDLKGWDFASGDPNVNDANGHGTHVSGTIGAEGNNAAGVTGVNWRLKVMPLRAGNSTLSGLAIEQAFRYACAEGAQVVNGSFGSPSPDPFVRDAIEDCPGTLFVFAAGNESTNNDAQPRYPCNYSATNIVCVAASEEDETLAPFSNYGLTNVDLAAPGAGILSTIPGGTFDYFDGTSMASPHVAGAAALVLSHRPTLTPLELKNTLLLSVDKAPAYSGAVKTGGRLNVARALSHEVTPPTGLTVSSPSHAGGWSANSTVQVAWSGAADENGIGAYSFAFSPVADFVPDEMKDTTATTLTMSLPDGEHWFHVRAVDGQGNWGRAVHVGPIRIDTFQPVRPVPSSPSHQVGGVSADRTIDVAWSGASDAQSGLDGFAFSWTQGRAGSPPTVKNLEETVSRVTSPQLAVGAWWFNIRGVDNAGNWSDAVSVGPFSIRVGPAACTVPRLRGLALVAAKRLLAKKGCSLGRVSRVRSRRVARGRVVAQRPAPGIRLGRGARIRLVLSRGRR